MWILSVIEPFKLLTVWPNSYNYDTPIAEPPSDVTVTATEVVRTPLDGAITMLKGISGGEATPSCPMEMIGRN